MTRTLEKMVGETFTRVVVNKDKDIIDFYMENGDYFHMFHNQDCCESVTIEDVCGDLFDLTETPIMVAEERTSEDRPSDVSAPEWEPDSQTWTFYTFRTMKGTVDIRWFGESNGYYSESCDIRFVKDGESPYSWDCERV